MSDIGNLVIGIFEGLVNILITKINDIITRVKFLLSLYAMVTPGADQSRLDSEASRIETIPLAKFDRFDSGSFAEKQRGDLSQAKALRAILEQSSKIFENQYEQVKDGLDQMVIDYIQSIRDIKKIQEDVINEQNSQINKLQGLRGPGKNVFDRATDSLSAMKQQGEETGGALKSVFGNLSNALQNFVRTGKLDFKELMRSILADLLKLFMNNLFKQLFSGMMGGGGGSFLGGLFGGGMAGGGVVSAAGGYGSTTTKLPGG